MKTAAIERRQEQKQGQLHQHSISRLCSYPFSSSKSDSTTSNLLFDRKIDLVTVGLRASLSKRLRYEVCHENSLSSRHLCFYPPNLLNLGH